MIVIQAFIYDCHSVISILCTVGIELHRTVSICFEPSETVTTLLWTQCLLPLLYFESSAYTVRTQDRIIVHLFTVRTWFHIFHLMNYNLQSSVKCGHGNNHWFNETLYRRIADTKITIHLIKHYIDSFNKNTISKLHKELIYDVYFFHIIF